jgi:hypothetical protein
MIEQSLKRLRAEKITFYNIWNLKTMDEYRAVTRKGGNFDGMLKAKDEGLIEHICCTVHAESGTIKEIIADGKVDAVTLPYNALNFAYRREGLKACHDQNLGVVVMNPLGGGAIPQYADRFAFLKSAPEESVVTAALKFLLGHEEISVTLPGIANIRELEENIAAASVGIPAVSEERIAALTAQLGKELNTLCTSCRYCEPCPAGVPVSQLAEAYNSYILSGEKKDITNRLRWHWDLTPAAALGCVKCGVCEPRCTQKLPIVDRLTEIGKI